MTAWHSVDADDIVSWHQSCLSWVGITAVFDYVLALISNNTGNCDAHLVQGHCGFVVHLLKPCLDFGGCFSNLIKVRRVGR